MSGNIYGRWSKWGEPPRFGDLVIDEDNCIGVVIGVEGDSANGLGIVVFLSNGVTIERPAEELKPCRLPGRTAVANLSEVLKSPGELLPRGNELARRNT